MVKEYKENKFEENINNIEKYLTDFVVNESGSKSIKIKLINLDKSKTSPQNLYFTLSENYYNNDKKISEYIKNILDKYTDKPEKVIKQLETKHRWQIYINSLSNFVRVSLAASVFIFLLPTLLFLCLLSLNFIFWLFYRLFSLPLDFLSMFTRDTKLLDIVKIDFNIPHFPFLTVAKAIFSNRCVYKYRCIIRNDYRLLLLWRGDRGRNERC